MARTLLLVKAVMHVEGQLLAAQILILSIAMSVFLAFTIIIFLRKVFWKWEFSKRCLWEIAKWNYFDLIFFFLKIQYIERKVKLILFFLVHWLNQKVLGVVNNNISKLSSFHLFVLIWLWSPSTLNPIASIWRLNSSRVRSFNT